MSELSFSVWLKQELNKAGMSGGELAQRARVSRSGVYFYLDGSRIPDRKVIEKLAVALGLEPASVPEFPTRAVGARGHKKKV